MSRERLEKRGRLLAQGFKRAREAGDDAAVLRLVRESLRWVADCERVALEEERRREGGGR